MKFIYRIIDEKGVVVAEDEDKNLLNLFLKWLRNYHGTERTFKIHPTRMQYAQDA
jgi:hypothetical protein